MANIIKYNTPVVSWTAETTLQTNLTSLANAGTAVSGVIDNTSNLALLADLTLELASITPTGNPYIEIHIIPAVDEGTGSTFADFFAGGPTRVAVLATTTLASAKNFIANGLIIPLGKFKFGVVNETGVTLSGTAPTVAYQTYDYNNNG